jgi:hypothetical protein
MPDIAPLGADEVDLAVRLSSEDERLRGVVGGRSRTVLVQPTTIDRKDSEARQAVVGFYDYDTNRSLVAVVDLGAQEVRAVEETPVQFQLSQEEKQEAEELVAGDQRARDFLGDRNMNPLTRLFFPSYARRDDPPHRYAVVFLLPSASERRFAVVDLSDRRVVEVFGPERLTAQ